MFFFLRQVIWLGAIIYGLYRCLVLCQPAELHAAGTRPSLCDTRQIPLTYTSRDGGVVR